MHSQKPFLRKTNFQLLKGGVSYCLSVRKGASAGRRWCGHSELSVTRVSVLFLTSGLYFVALNVQYN